MVKRNKDVLPAVAEPAYPARLYTTSEGRQVFPDILQDAFGEKAITGFHRYGRVLGAVVPMEAVMLLAGQPVDEEAGLRLRNAAQALLEERRNYR